MEELKQLKEEIQELINKNTICNGKNTMYEQALKQVIELIYVKTDSITSNINKENNLK